VERLEDDLDVFAGEAVEMSNNGIKFIDLVLLYLLVKRTNFHIVLIRPVRITFIDSRETTREFNDTFPKWIITPRSRNRESLDNLKSKMSLNETPSIPVC